MRALLLIACLLVGACSGAGGIAQSSGSADAQNALLQRIERRVTTKEQVRALAGDAAKIEPMAEGYEQWTYQSTGRQIGGNYIAGVGSTPEGHEERTVEILFDKQGIVADYISYAQVRNH